MVGLHVRKGLQIAMFRSMLWWRRLARVCAGQRGLRRGRAWGFAVEVRVIDGRESKFAHENVFGDE